MSWHYLQELGEDYLDQSKQDTTLSVLSSGNPIASSHYNKDRETECCHPFPSGMTSIPLTGDPGVDMWILSLLDSPVSPSQLRENSELVRIQGMDGPPPFESFAKLAQDGSCLRTYQVSLLDPMGTCTPYSDSFPRSGLIVDGIAYLRTPVVRPTNGTGSGLLEGLALFPTPTCFRGPSEGSVRKMRRLIEQGHITREEAAVMIDGDPFKKQGNIPEHFPTPLAHMTKESGCPSEGRRNEPTLSFQVGGHLNPEWVELLMGWPKGWTSLEPLPSEVMDDWLEAENYWSLDWESDTPRTGKKDNNSSRLKAIGNGQVPACAVKAWRLLR